MPDSRAEAKGLGSAKRDERPVRGRRHLVVNSQVKRQSRKEREARAASSKRHFRMPFYLTRANAREADFRQKIQDSGKYFLECRHAVRTRDWRPAQSAALEAYLAQN